MKTVILYTNLLAFSIVSCKTNDINYDASGAFETVETIVPAEANGIIRELLLEEGNTIPAGKVIGYIDTLQLFLKKKQLEAQAGAILSKRHIIATEIAALQEELRYAKNEQERLTNLVKADARSEEHTSELQSREN